MHHGPVNMPHGSLSESQNAPDSSPSTDHRPDLQVPLASRIGANVRVLLDNKEAALKEAAAIVIQDKLLPGIESFQGREFPNDRILSLVKSGVPEITVNAVSGWMKQLGAGQTQPFQNFNNIIAACLDLTVAAAAQASTDIDQWRAGSDVIQPAG